MSLILKPNAPIHRWGCVSFPLGIAIHQAFGGAASSRQQCGIEMAQRYTNQWQSVGMRHDTNASLGVIILGIGINVNQVPEDVDRTSLRCASGQVYQRWTVLNDILSAIGENLD